MNYVTKPFGMREFLARLRVAIRHGLRTPEGEASVILSWGVGGSISLNVKSSTSRGTLASHAVEFRLLKSWGEPRRDGVTHLNCCEGVGSGQRRANDYLRGLHEATAWEVGRQSCAAADILTETGGWLPVGHRGLTADLNRKPNGLRVGLHGCAEEIAEQPAAATSKRGNRSILASC